ncbi:hypothetical protein [Flavobacterium caeni]|uniref:FG-GAP repeat-containing protein n=1 Tax=Flavobacterium caeni TaxID=490189 RepID=A0A1G5KDC9_9FLAO|nr:hypothetical protein [Flavobacterium caeni]SCY98261.1 hypothetical protein SAMN02927903_03231 [Flavobacterium caeni]
MNKVVILFLTFLLSNSISAQESRYNIDNSAKLILSSSKLKNDIEISSSLNSSEKISIRWKAMNYNIVLLNSKNEEYIKSFDDEKSNIVDIYEYDFDKDNNKELIIINSLSEGYGKIYILRRNGLFVKECGTIDLGIGITIDNSIFKVFTGVRDYSQDYIYLDNKIWKLCELESNGY